MTNNIEILLLLPHTSHLLQPLDVAVFGPLTIALTKRLEPLNRQIRRCLQKNEWLEQYALAYPEIRFSVISDGRQIFATPGDNQLSSALIEVYGLEIAEQMVPISSLDGHDDDPDDVL